MKNFREALKKVDDAFHQNRLLYVLRAHLGEAGGQLAKALEHDLAELAAEKAAEAAEAAQKALAEKVGQ